MLSFKPVSNNKCVCGNSNRCRSINCQFDNQDYSDKNPYAWVKDEVALEALKEIERLEKEVNTLQKLLQNTQAPKPTVDTTVDQGWKHLATSYFAFGSRHVCTPPVMHTDEDWAVLDNSGAVATYMQNNGWIVGGSYRQVSAFTSYKKGDQNVIIMKTKNIYDKYKTATDIVKSLNIRDKKKRIDMYNRIVAL